MKHIFKTLPLFLLVLASCGSIKPEAPEIIVQEDRKIPDAPMSAIKVPIKINLKPYFDETDRGIDRKFSGEEQNCSGVSFQYRFLRSPIKFKGVGKKLLFDVDGKYSVALNYCPSCSDLFSSEPYCLTPRIYASCGVNEPMRKIEVGYATEIGVTKDYRLQSVTKLRKLEPKSPCKITAFEYDATSTLKSEVKKALQDLERDIDKEISAVSLKEDIKDTWQLLAASTDLEGYGFLELNPKGISMGKITYAGDTAYFNAILKAKPIIRSIPSGKTPPPLPRLSDYNDREGFDITMDLQYGYDSLNAILSRNIKGTKLDVKGKEVIFGDITIHGASNEKLSIKVDFSGSKSGTLYLTGTPHFDANLQHISFPDMEFDVKTKSALLKSAKWLFDKKVTKLIRESASMDLKPYLDDLRKELTKSLNGELDKGVHMYGRVKEIKINEIHPMSNQLFVRLHSLGKLGIRLD